MTPAPMPDELHSKFFSIPVLRGFEPEFAYEVLIYLHLSPLRIPVAKDAETTTFQHFGLCNSGIKHSDYYSPAD